MRCRVFASLGFLFFFLRFVHVFAFPPLFLSSSPVVLFLRSSVALFLRHVSVGLDSDEDDDDSDSSDEDEGKHADAAAAAMRSSVVAPVDVRSAHGVTHAIVTHGGVTHCVERPHLPASGAVAVARSDQPLDVGDAASGEAEAPTGPTSGAAAAPTGPTSGAAEALDRKSVV